ncbi:MAG: hypothetical protein JW839_10810 [Candidatus Lokiarchaeota archaeon]|nr:hypothetical protein [Candidatus Lokiarchaeota archaeon]
MSNEILPAWNILAACIMLAASIATLLVFTAGDGRYVPTGSVLGFQGPSYFYVTGFWGILLSLGWGISIATKLKRLSISARRDGAILLRERVIGKTREVIIPPEGLKAFFVDRHPSPGGVAWLVIGFGWLAFLLQLAMPNFQLPFLEHPVTGMTLLVFGGCIAATAVMGVSRPGLCLVLMDAAACHFIKLPGVISAETLASEMTTALEKSFKLQPVVLSRTAFELKNRDWFRTTLFGSVAVLIIGSVNVVFLLAGTSLSCMNQGSAWVTVVSGCLGMVFNINRGNALPLHTRVAFHTTLAWNGKRDVPGPWLFVVGIAGCVISWYFVGLHARFDMTGLVDGLYKVISLGAVSLLYTSWCIYFAMDPSHRVLVSLGGGYSAAIGASSTSVQQSSRPRHRVFDGDLWMLAIALLFGAVSVITFCLGLLS